MIVQPIRVEKKPQPNNFLPGCSGGKQPHGGGQTCIFGNGDTRHTSSLVNINISKNLFMSVQPEKSMSPTHNPPYPKTKQQKPIWDSDCFVCIQFSQYDPWCRLGSRLPSDLTHTHASTPPARLSPILLECV